MKHVLLIVFIAFASLSFTTKAKPKDIVYVCISKGSTVYHGTRSCSGLGRCTHEIRVMTKQEAIDMGRRDCHVCWPG